ncbi:MAG: fibronectin type III domain-containing protein, partial [Opitutaceae bacterium]|nr:fibronectin type III domain-containing protein [Opitutaceae bacterium]
NGLWTFGGADGTRHPDAGDGKIADDFGSAASRIASFASIGGAAPATPGVNHLYMAGAGAGWWFSEINGAWLASHAGNTVRFPATITLGAADDLFLEGDIAEILVYDRPLTAAERERAGAYLVQKYALFPPPDAPDVFEAFALSATGIGLRWSPSLPGHTYAIDREITVPDDDPESETGWKKTWLPLAEIRGEEGASFVDAGLAPATRYDYRLRARNLAGEAEPVFADATTPDDGTPPPPPPQDWKEPVDLDALPLPPAPEGFRLRPQEDEDFWWQDNSPIYTFDWDAAVLPEGSPLVIAGYRVYAGDRLLAETGPAITTCDIDPATLPRGRYTLHVVAVDQHGRESLPSNPLTIEIDPLVDVEMMQANRSFYAQVEIKRIINQYYPPSSVADQSGHRPYTVHLLPQVPWNRQADNYPSIYDDYLRTISYTSTRTIAALTVGHEGTTPMINTQGAYRFRVDNYDGRARRVRFRWVEMFCPFPVGVQMGPNADTEWRPGSSIIGEPHEVILELAPGDTVACSDEYTVAAPTGQDERGQIRVYLIGAGLDLSAFPAPESGAGGVDSAAPPNVSLPSNTSAYLYPAACDVVIEQSEEGTPDPVTGKPAGKLYPLRLGPGIRQSELHTGNGYVMPLDSVVVDVQGGTNHLRLYAEEIATGLYTPVTFGAELKTPYFADKNAPDQYRFYIKGVQSGSVKLRQYMTITDGAAIAEEITVTVLPGDDALLPDANRDGVIDDDDKGQVTAAAPFRFWINDDADKGDVAGDDSDIPDKPGEKANHYTKPRSGKTGPSYGKVDGRADPIDLFPVWLNIKPLITAYAANNTAGTRIKYRLRHENGAVNVVWAGIHRTQARDYLTDDVVWGHGAGMNMAHEAETQQVTAVGVEIPGEIIDFATQYDGAVIYLEGRAATTEPLLLEILQDDAVVSVKKLSLKISPIEEMYRRKSLLNTAQNQSGVHMENYIGDYGVPGAIHSEEPENWPDSLCRSDRAFVFLHGYNVNPHETRAWGAEMFKRLFWSGSRTQLHLVVWPGAESQMASTFTPDFHVNVVNAFNAAPALAAYLQSLADRNLKVTTGAHSLGNMVVASALWD